MFIHSPLLRVEQLSWCVESKQANVVESFPPFLVAGFWSSATSIVKLRTVRRALTRVHSWI